MLYKCLFYPAALNKLPRDKTKAKNTNDSTVIMRAELMCLPGSSHFSIV